MKVLKLVLLFFIILQSCEKRENTLFHLLSPSDTGIDFNNEIIESEEFNIIRQEYLYNGGGVAIGDFDNNGLKDIFFTANLTANRLYLNKGDLEFEDISDIAGIGAINKWKSGVAIADVNGDGWDDIYVCATILASEDERRNMLFINQGLNDDGIPVFKDEAASYGVDDPDYSSNAVFFDYDKDGDLDLYVLTNAKQHGVPITYRPKVNDGTDPTVDKLYRNNGNNTFTDVSREAGIIYEGYGLGIAVFDGNNDGWPDLYISNDYLTNDVMYMNKQGTFVNEIDTVIQHQSKFSMGNDIADINNDGFSDIITLDMLPEENYRKKTVIGAAGYINYIYDKRYGYTHQYTRNMLQVNNGDGTYSEIGQLAGIYQTEWSWSPLFADFDNDGKRDLIVTNGFPKDITDKDFINFRMEVGPVLSTMQLLDKIPSVKVPNYAYQNVDGLQFRDVTKDWGMDQPSFSNGAAYADLDNDGDLDYVVNNINSEAFVYENQLYGLSGKKGEVNHYLKVKLKGPALNRDGEGARVFLVTGNARQFHYQNTYRGYISRVDPSIHFGLGNHDSADSLTVIWPDGRRETKVAVKADQEVEFDYASSSNTGDSYHIYPKKRNELVKEVSDAYGLNYKHPFYDVIDFNFQRTLPHKFSESGPPLAVGDINGDELEDLLIGGYATFPVTAFIQQKSGGFIREELIAPKEHVDMGLLLFDADNDGDLDLYAMSGGFRYGKGSDMYRDRLYLNNGQGKFTLNEDALPPMTESGGVVRAADIDRDGDLDLFLGSRVVPSEYPLAPQSAILRNDKGVFTDVTEEIAPGLSRIGMVTDALWTDVDGDDQKDLLVTGEFMAIKLFLNKQGNLKIHETSGLGNYKGWWNSLTAGDFDNDGDIDYVAGNLGLNNHYNISESTPLCIYADDYDQNNSIDAVLACHLRQSDTTKLFPVHLWEEIATQSPMFRKKFKLYHEYGQATIDSLLTPEQIENSYKLQANYTQTSLLRNDGKGNFKVEPLPLETQTSPVNGMVSYDLNGDGNLDILMQGNDYGNEVFSGTYDAMKGLVLLGDGTGKFSVKNHVESGFSVPGNAKAMVMLVTPDGPVIISSQNKGDLKVYKPERASRVITPGPQDKYALVTMTDGKQMRMEFYKGNGYLSQSSGSIVLPARVREVKIYQSDGAERLVIPEPM